MNDLPVLVAGVVVSPSVVEPVGWVPVLVCNPSSTMATIHKGTRIGRATHLDATLVASATDTAFESQEGDGPVVPEGKAKMLWKMVEDCTADLGEEERDVLYHLLILYADVFAESNDLLGRTGLV